MASLRARRDASPLPPFGTDADLDSAAGRGRSVAHQPSRVREPSMKEIFTSPVETPQARGRSRGPPGGASSISFGDSLSVPSAGTRARTRSPSRGDAGWNGSGGMAGVMGSGAPSRSRSRGPPGVSADSPFFTSPSASSLSVVPPVPAVPAMATRAVSPPIPALARAASPAVPHSRSDSAVSSIASPSSPIRAYTSTSSARAPLSDYTTPSLAAPTDMSSSLFSDPDVFNKVEAKMMDFKQKLAAANARADKLAVENKSLQGTVARLEQDTHKLSIDKHQAHLRAQALEADLATERRERQAERAQHAAEHASLASKLRGDATHRGSAERDLESLRADHAKVTLERDEYRAEVASLTANLALAQRQLADVQRKLEVVTQERERREMAWNDAEKARLELEAKLGRLAVSTRSMAGTNDALSEELRYLQAMVHEERQRRVKAETQLEEERRRRVLDME